MSTESTDAEHFEDLSEKSGRFRILIIGRANADKTTILRGICDTMDDPEIYAGNRKKVDPSQVDGSTGVRFSLTPLHRGWLSADSTTSSTNLFSRATTRGDSKPVAQRSSEGIYRRSCKDDHTQETYSCDMAVERMTPADRRLPLQERRSKAESLVEGVFRGADVWDHLSRIKYPPRSSVRIRDMHKSNKGCTELVDATLAVLNQEALQMLLISAQEANIALSVKYPVQSRANIVDKVYNSLISLGEQMG